MVGPIGAGEVDDATDDRRGMAQLVVPDLVGHGVGPRVLRGTESAEDGAALRGGFEQLGAAVGGLSR